VETIGLDGENAGLWSAFIAGLEKSHIRLRNERDTLAWAKNKNRGGYTERLGYKVMMED